MLNAMAAAEGPVIVDVGANTAGSLLPLIREASGRYGRRGITFALLVVITSEPGALANARCCSTSQRRSPPPGSLSRTRSKARSIQPP